MFGLVWFFRRKTGKTWPTMLNCWLIMGCTVWVLPQGIEPLGYMFFCDHISIWLLNNNTFVQGALNSISLEIIRFAIAISFIIGNCQLTARSRRNYLARMEPLWSKYASQRAVRNKTTPHKLKRARAGFLVKHKGVCIKLWLSARLVLLLLHCILV